MHLKIRKIHTSEELFLEFMLLLGLFFGYFEVTNIWNAGIILLSAWLFISSKRIQISVKRNAVALVLILVLGAYIILNIMNTDARTYLSYNLIQIVRPIIILLVFYYISNENNSRIYNFLYSKFYFLNFMWVINLVVLGLQVAGTGFMMKASWLAANSFYEDNCTGLFGGSATHVVMLFTAFITLYNLEIGIKHFTSQVKRNIFLLYIFVTLAIMFLFSTSNENTAMFIFVPLFLAWYYLHKLKVTNVALFKKVFDILKYIIFAVVLFVVLEMIPGVSDFINNTVISKVNGVINFLDTNQLGSVERFAIVSDAFIRGFGWKFGQGLGAWNIMGGASGYAGFLHFGLSSIGSFVYLIGIWGYLIILLVYSYLLSHMSNSGARLSVVITFLVVNLLCSYTMFLTATHATVWSIFIFLIFNNVCEEKYGQHANSKK